MAGPPGWLAIQEFLEGQPSLTARSGMSRRMLKAAVIVFVGALVVLWAAYVVWHPKTDEQRWSELLHSARVAVLFRSLHLIPLEALYQRRVDATEKALLASGYLTEVSIPVQDSRTRVGQLLGTITNMPSPHQATQWQLDWSRDVVRVTCRTQDVFLWRRSLTEHENP